MENKISRNRSFIFGALVAMAFLIAGICFWTSSGDATQFLGAVVLAILSFTFISCLLLDNNFIGDVVSGIFGFGFLKMPILIFELDLDGIIWFLTVKLILWVLGLVLAVIFGILAIVIGAVLSLFVYPFALYNNITNKEVD